MKKADCHPEQKYHCKGLCAPCYRRATHLRRKQNPQYMQQARQRARIWALENPERIRELDVRNNLMKKYGITLEHYEQLYSTQNGCCALCDKPETIKLNANFKTNKLAVDHCHKTNKIRGLLCFRCNIALGQIDKENLASKLPAYLGVTT